MKSAAGKILIIILLTGVICLIGEIILSREMVRMQEIHDNIMTEHVRNREYIAEIGNMLYEHQSMLANYALSDSDELRAEYKAREAELRQKMTEKIIAFSFFMKGGEKEKIYHRVYSNFSGYDDNVSLFLDFAENNQMNMAVYYNDNVLKTYLDEIKSRFEDLNLVIQNEINRAERAMIRASLQARFLRYAVAVVIIAFFTLCAMSAAGIASRQEKYKEQLEKEINQKNIEIYRHNRDMLHLQDGVIYSLANLIESRDGETGEHVKRTSAYVEMIARAAKEQGLYKDILTDEYIERLVRVAPLHDVGKIVVPDQILMKAEKLTPEEYEKIKSHAPRGREIITAFFEHVEDKDYVKMACDVAGYHHERWDGKGYASGLAGEQIPLSARIMALADVFDALQSPRRYKTAYSIDETFRIIDGERGAQFDPRLTDILLMIRPEIEKYLARSKG